MTESNWGLRAVVAAWLAAASLGAAAQTPPPAAPATADVSAEAVRITHAWARASVPGQKATGAFMTLTANTPLQLVGVASPVAGVAEVHEMARDGDVMRMQPVQAIEIPAGGSVTLRPGGLHLMLVGLSAPLRVGEAVPVTLTFEHAGAITVQVPVQAAGATGPHGHS